LPLDRMYTVST